MEMENKQENKPEIRKRLIDRYEVCESCGYDKGFHILVAKLATQQPPRNVKMRLKCPNCGQTYDLGLRVSTAGEGEMTLG